MWKWIVGVAFTLACFAAMTITWLGTNEEICFDRSPWWGPPKDPNVYTTCSGHMWERHEAGYGWFGGPK